MMTALPTDLIQRLPEDLIAKIAAGEVVERPASIVKELIENALDAGASRVEIELEEGGRRRILVRDDGAGMSARDAELAFEPHATSKISEFDDLERIKSYGFRGEALASIAAVARTELSTATRAGEGLRLVLSGGRVELREPAGLPRGTVLEVHDLFSTVPARRQFLKGASAESRRCVEVVQGYALAMPTVGFRLESEGREVLLAAPCTDQADGHLERIAQVFGSHLASELIALPHRPGVSGFVGRPSTARGRRIFLFVNRRLIKDRGVLAAFYRTVRDEWKSERFPALFLFLDVPPEELDVNVHPQKTEVRFKDQRIIGRVVNSLKSALAEGRGEGIAPLSRVSSVPASGLAWQTSTMLQSEVISEGRPSQDPNRLDGERGAALETSPLAQAPPFQPVDGQSRLPHYQPRPGAGSSPLSRGTQGRPLRLLGQYKGSLLLLEGEDGLYLVDQHAAHERILFEQFRRTSLAGPVQSQRLLTPRWLEVSEAESSALREVADGLEDLGFEIASLSGKSVGMTSIPAFFDEQEAERTLLDLAARISASELAEDEAIGLRREMLESMAASSACRTAVRIHRRLPEEQMRILVTDLFQCEQPYSCPHGRPTLLQMADSELERRFGRR